MSSAVLESYMKSLSQCHSKHAPTSFLYGHFIGWYRNFFHAQLMCNPLLSCRMLASHAVNRRLITVVFHSTSSSSLPCAFSSRENKIIVNIQLGLYLNVTVNLATVLVCIMMLQPIYIVVFFIFSQHFHKYM